MEFVEVGDEILGKRVVVQHPAFVNTPPSIARLIATLLQGFDSDRAPGPYFQIAFKGVRALSFCG